MYYNPKIIAKDVLFGGRLQRKYYTVGRGALRNARPNRDRFNRITIRVGRGGNTRTVARSMPKISSRDVMDSIGNSLTGISLGRGRKIRGNGISIM